MTAPISKLHDPMPVGATAPPRTPRTHVWTFRAWSGMTTGVWFRFLARHRFAVSPSRWGAAVVMSVFSCVSAIPSTIQRLRHGREVAAEPIPPPVFIVGHWRSGTTFLHELLATDGRFVAPTVLECVSTDHFLRSSRFLKFFSFLLPKRRPMDEMPMRWDRPQETEFALMAMGLPSPYEVMVFPNQRSATVDHLHIADMPAVSREAWQAGLRRFMQRVALNRRWAHRKGGPKPTWFLAKSPPDTARIGELAQMFPAAKFVHIVRDPRELHPSNRLLWQATFDSQGLQKPRYDDSLPHLDDFIINSAQLLYRDFDDDVAALRPGAFVETRYEDLTRDPTREIARIRRELGLDGGNPAALAAHLAGVRGYRRNRHHTDPAATATIDAAWRWYAERFGYAEQEMPQRDFG